MSIEAFVSDLRNMAWALARGGTRLIFMFMRPLV